MVYSNLITGEFDRFYTPRPTALVFYSYKRRYVLVQVRMIGGA